MTDPRRPPVRRFRTKLDMRRLEHEQRRGKLKAPSQSPRVVKCPRCGKFATPVRVLTKDGDEQERCEQCYIDVPLDVILRWGPSESQAG